MLSAHVKRHLRKYNVNNSWNECEADERYLKICLQK